MGLPWIEGQTDLAQSRLSPPHHAAPGQSQTCSVAAGAPAHAHAQARALMRTHTLSLGSLTTSTWKETDTCTFQTLAYKEGAGTCPPLPLFWPLPECRGDERSCSSHPRPGAPGSSLRVAEQADGIWAPGVLVSLCRPELLVFRLSHEEENHSVTFQPLLRGSTPLSGL